MSTLEAPQLVVPEVVSHAAESRSARILHWSLLVASILVLAAAILLEIRGRELVAFPLMDRSLPQLCYWRAMFGIDCPGCGLTRCFIACAQGKLAAAWGYNPVGMLLFATVVFQVPYRPWQLWRLSSGRRELCLIGLPYMMLGISALLIIQWLARLILGG
jgi:hypothetical protein